MRASLVERRLHKEVLAGFRGESIFMILGDGDLLVVLFGFVEGPGGI